MAQRDYYSVLEVPRDADAAAIKKAHRKLARKLHPDVNKDDPDAPRKFQEVQEAYDVLGDPEKRKMYDQFGRAGTGAAGGAPGSGGDPFEAFRRGAAGGGFGGGGFGGGGRPIDPEDLEELRNGQFGDIFEGLFGSAGPFGRRGGGPRPGPGDYASSARSRPRPAELSIEVPVTIDFRDSAFGTSVRITTPGEQEKIEAKIPAGVKDGQRVRLRGRGRKMGGAVGDLILIVTVRDHEYFKRSGLNVVLEVPVSVWDALLGGRVEVPTLDGNITVTIPPGSGGGQKLRIKGRGFRKGDERGDQIVVLKILVPKELSNHQRTIVERLQGELPVDTASEAPWK